MFVVVALSFILFTPLGAISHEYGHIVVARFLGYNTTLHFGSMKWDQSQIGIEIDSYYKLHEERIESSVQNREKTHFENLLRKRRRDSLWISIGGPLQTMLTGTVGFLWVWYKKNKASSRFNLWYLTSVLLALFWLRQIANLSLSTFKGIWSGDYFGGDEERISILLGLWPGTISIITAAIGLLVCLIVIFKFLPTNTRLPFLLGGMVGGTLGFPIWMKWIGPIVLP